MTTELEKKYPELEQKIISALKTVYDPEIPINIYELGLIYEIKISDEKDVYIKMTLTSPNCPVAEDLPRDIREALQAVEEIKEVNLELTFEPEWNRDMISEAGQLELGFL